MTTAGINLAPIILTSGPPPTRSLHRSVATDGSFSETEYASISSVEVGQDAKGTSYVKSVKVYGPDPEEAAKEALKVLRFLMKELNEAKG